MAEMKQQMAMQQMMQGPPPAEAGEGKEPDEGDSQPEEQE
jgi:hypothetical protein